MEQHPSTPLRDEDMDTIGPGATTARVADTDERDTGPGDDADEQDVDGTDQADDADTSDADSTDTRDS